MNYLKPHRKALALSMLLEGCSLRAVSRLTGIHRTTLLHLLTATGAHCAALLERELRDLRCAALEADEIWTFVRKKQRRLSSTELHDPEAGDQYTYIALDTRSKLVAAHLTGRRATETTTAFIEQLRRRVPRRIQLCTDGYVDYADAVESTYGSDIDYAQVVKPVRGLNDLGTVVIARISGYVRKVSTSFVERHNLTIRQQLRRFTRRTLGFSKKLANLRAAVDVYMAWYNFVRVHGSLRVTPAMAAGVTSTVWDLDRLIA